MISLAVTLEEALNDLKPVDIAGQDLFAVTCAAHTNRQQTISTPGKMHPEEEAGKPPGSAYQAASEMRSVSKLPKSEIEGFHNAGDDPRIRPHAWCHFTDLCRRDVEALSGPSREYLYHLLREQGADIPVL